MFRRKKNENRNENSVNNALNQNPLLKQGIFFGFYFVFFLILILLLRTGYTKNASKEVQLKKTGYGYDCKLDRLIDNNYHFVYKEYINGVQKIYEGDTDGKSKLYVKSGQVSTQYYQKSDVTYEKDNNLLTWKEIDNPLQFYKFTIPTALQKIIRKAEYVSKTDYLKMNKSDFTYKISNTKLRRIYDLEEYRDDDSESTFVVSVLENGTLAAITFDLSTYMSRDDSNIKSYLLTLNFSKYDEIQEITNPMN